MLLDILNLSGMHTNKPSGHAHNNTTDTHTPDLVNVRTKKFTSYAVVVRQTTRYALWIGEGCEWVTELEEFFFVTFCSFLC